MNLEANPWKTLASRIIYTNPWITVREDDVIRPDGSPGIYSVIETRVAVATIALTAAHEVYLVGQYRYPTRVYSWELVEGGTDLEEAPLDAAKRELQEEAGLRAARWRLVAGPLQMSNCISSEIAYIYLAQDLLETQLAPEPTEVLQLRRIPFQECLRLVDEGVITDAFSIMGLLKLERMLRSGSL